MTTAVAEKPAVNEAAFVNDTPGMRQWRTSSSARAAYTYVPKGALPRMGATSMQDDPIARVKLFNHNTTWYLLELDEPSGDAYGLVVGQVTEPGYFCLHELSALRGQFGLPVERDIHFKPTPISELRKRHER